MVDAILVFITVPTRDLAQSLAMDLVESHLAACVTEFPVRSTYRWQGEILQDQEIQLMVKTRADRFDDLELRVKALHPYEVPEIIAIPIRQGSEAYLNWINTQT